MDFRLIWILISLFCVAKEGRCQGNEDSSETNALQERNNNKNGQENNNNNNNNAQQVESNTQQDIELSPQVHSNPTPIPTAEVVANNNYNNNVPVIRKLYHQRNFNPVIQQAAKSLTNEANMVETFSSTLGDNGGNEMPQTAPYMQNKEVSKTVINNEQSKLTNQNTVKEEDNNGNQNGPPTSLRTNESFGTSSTAGTETNLNENESNDNSNVGKEKINNDDSKAGEGQVNGDSATSESNENSNEKVKDSNENGKVSTKNEDALNSFSFKKDITGAEVGDPHPTFSYKHTFFDLSDLNIDIPSLDGTNNYEELLNHEPLKLAKNQLFDNIDSDEIIVSKVGMGSIEGPSSHEIFQNDGNEVYLGSNVNVMFENNDNNDIGSDGNTSQDHKDESVENGNNSGTDADDACNNMDILFVVDSSDDVSEMEFRYTKQTLLKLSNILQNKFKSRVGVVWYGSRIADTIPLSNNISFISSAIKTSSKEGGPNKPYLGILAGRADLSMLSSEITTKVMVFLASGLQQYTLPASQQSSLAKDDGIKIVAIGYGDGAIVSDLEDIASSDSFVLKYDQASAMYADAANLPSVICKAAISSTDEVSSETTSTESDNSDSNGEESDDNESFNELLTATSDVYREETPNNSFNGVDSSGSSESDEDLTLGKNSMSKETSEESDAIVNTNQSPEDMCKNSKMVQGVGYKRYGLSCDKFIQCFYDQFGNTRASVKTCPFGEYWDHNDIACVDSSTANCPYDLCKKQISLARPIEGNCRAHWTCLNGQSSIMCCPDQMAFHPGKGCVADTDCSTPCHQEQEPEEGTCDKRPMYGKPYLYKQWIESGHWVEMLCAPGTLFDEDDCGCTMRTTYVTTLGVRAVAVDTCRPELYLPFCEGVKDWSGRNTLVQNENDRVIVVNGKAYFNGQASLFIPRFSGATYGETIYIKMRYKPDFSESSDDKRDIIDDESHLIHKRSVLWRNKRDSQIENDGQNGDVIKQESATEPSELGTENTILDFPAPTETILANSVMTDSPVDSNNNHYSNTVINQEVVNVDISKSTDIDNGPNGQYPTGEKNTDFSGVNEQTVTSDSKDTPSEFISDIGTQTSVIVSSGSGQGEHTFDLNNGKEKMERHHNSGERANTVHKDQSQESVESNSEEKNRPLFETSYFDNHRSNTYTDLAKPHQTRNADTSKSYFSGWFGAGDRVVNDESAGVQDEKGNQGTNNGDMVNSIISDGMNSQKLPESDPAYTDYSSADNDVEGDGNNAIATDYYEDSGDNLSDISSAESIDQDVQYEFTDQQVVNRNRLPEDPTFSMSANRPNQQRIYGGRYFAETNADAEREKYNFLNLLHKERIQMMKEIEQAKADMSYPTNTPKGSTSATYSDMALLSNAVCSADFQSKCLDDPSVSIGTGRDSTSVSVYATESKKTTINLQKNSKVNDGWRTVLLTIDEGVFRVFDRDSTDFEPISGQIKTTFSGIYIGQGTGMSNFKGYIDEVYVYLCKPNDIDDFRSISTPKPNTESDNENCDYINKNVAKQYSDNSESSENTDDSAARL